MLLFVIYAVAIWYAVYRTRRTLRGMACLLGGVALLIVVAWLHYKLQEWTTFDIFLPVLQIILYPYTVLVLGVGVFFLWLPHPGCRVCGYDISQLAHASVCPECGSTYEERTTRRGRRVARRRHAEHANLAPAPASAIRLTPEQRSRPTYAEDEQWQPHGARDLQHEQA